MRDPAESDFRHLQQARPLALASRDYRDSMARFAGAVHVVTTDGPAGRRGVTVTAAVSVSDNPPTLLVCLNRNRAENGFFARNGCLALNTLVVGQENIARAFAGEGHLGMDERFALGTWRTLETGAPVLAGSRMSLDCIVKEVRDIATHHVVVAEAVAAAPHGEGAALVYLDRQYRAL
jgi:cob(II)yrinic acid a,c-diamide reductase